MFVYSVSIFLSEPVKSRGIHIPTRTEKSIQLRMDGLHLFVGLFGTFLIGFDLPVVSAVYSCVSYSPYFKTEFCYNKQTCCGYYSYRYCCHDLSSGSIAGIVIGCIIGIVCLGVFIVVCCKMMNKNRGATGRVVYPNNGNANVTILNSQNHPVYPGYSQQGYPAYPTAPAYPPPGAGPAYPPAGPSQYPPPPPQYSQTDPAPAPYPQKY